MKRQLFFVICAFLFGLSALAPPVFAANFSVNTAADLITAINDANLTPAVDVIYLNNNIILSAVDNNTNGANGLPAITTEIIIVGNGFSISRAVGSPQFRLLYVAGGGFFGNGNLTLDNIALRGGDLNVGTDCFIAIEQCGGAILNYFGNVTIRNNSIFAGNIAYGGGAIFNTGDMDIRDTLFTGNSASFGSSVYNTGGLIGNSATVNIRTSTFTGNVSAFSGGAIHNQAELSVYDSSFTNNQVTDPFAFGNGGGAIYNTSFNGQAEIYSSIFTGNSAQRGGAISNYNASDMIIDNSDITGNFNVNFGDGGGIFSDNNTNLTVRNSRITNNQTTNFGNGGGIYSGQNNRLILENTIVSNNTAGSDGGGIYMNSINTTIASIITGSQIDNNTANADGGGIYKEGTSPVTIRASSISGNINNGFNGGGIYNNGGNITIQHSTIANNQMITGDAGGIGNENQGVLVIENSTISGNSVTGVGGVSGLGGGVYSNQTNSMVTITNTTISGNYAQSNGGGVYNNNASDMFLNNVTIFGNTADLQGGGVFALTDIFTTNTLIMNNTANHPVNPPQPDCSGLPAFIIDNGGNFVTDTTQCPAGFAIIPGTDLAPLADNGGGTQTHTLLPGSAAIDAVAGCGLAVDQRGVLRDANCDSGAFENAAIPPLVSFAQAASTVNESPGGAHTVTVILDNTAGNITGGTVEIYIARTGSAAIGSDYTQATVFPVTFTIPAPGTIITQDIALNILPDFFVEGNETIIFSFTDAAIVGAAEPSVITQHTVTIIDALADLSVTNEVVLLNDLNANGLFEPGDTIEYTITVTNNGVEDAVDVTVEDVLDALWLDVAGVVINASIGVYDATTNEWSLDGAGVGNGFALAALQIETLTIEATILAAPIGQLVTSIARISQAFPPGAADPIATNNLAPLGFTIGSPPPVIVAQTAGFTASNMGVFDPSISKIGLLVSGETGITGEQLQWIITITNRGSAVQTDVVVKDILHPRLRIDRVDAPNANVAISGQTVIVTIPVLNGGQSIQFSIFTMVLDGIEGITNTACVDGSSGTVCTTALPVTRLPITGESRRWHLLWLGVIIVAVMLLSLYIIIKKLKLIAG